jgi:tetratricopeptide (TPR) repeat protein
VLNSLDNLAQQANEALAQGQYERSCQFFREALALGHERADLHYGLGTVCFLLGDFSVSAGHFKEVTRLEPLRAKAYINLGALYNRLGQHDDAITTLQRGIQLDTRRGEGFYNLGLVYRHLDQLELATQAYREAIRLSPHLADAHFNLGNIFFEKRQFGSACAFYRQALELRPRWAKAHAALENAQAQQTPARPESTVLPAQPAQALDPNRLLDPNLHIASLRELRHLITEIDSQSRKLTEVLQQDADPGIKGLSNCLLFPDNPGYNLSEQLDKFDVVVQQVQEIQQSVQKRLQQVEALGEQMARS